MLCCGSTAVLRAVVGPFAMLFGPPCRLRVLRGVVEPAMSSFGPQGYRWAHRVIVWDAIVGPTVSWLNRSRCRQPHRVAVRLLASCSILPCRGWLPASWSGCSRRGRARRVVVVSQLSPPSRCSARRVIVWPTLSSFGRWYLHCGRVAGLVVVHSFPALRILVTR